ncbi:helix-turn-helix domain-containing protein [Methanolobus sp. ZRKC5]|uniref:TrmB family transcriptional regulator n=1 Tax=unclassified Methanolobus TaxID=2629569 RepID=UPI00313E5817
MNSLIESLQQLGLTSYEAKVLVTLTQYGSRNAADIHALSGIPRSAVYGVIDRLKDRGLVKVQNTKPMRYRAYAPDVIIDKLKASYEDAVKFSNEQLETIYQAQEGSVEEDSVWNISGVKNVNDKILQMMESADEEIIFASSYSSLKKVIEVYPIMDSIRQMIQVKLGEGVKIKITGRDKAHVIDIAKEFSGAEIRVYKEKSNVNPLKGGILVIDNEELLVITIKDDIAPLTLNATWYNGKEHVCIFRHFIEAEWDTSRPVDV